MNKQKINNITDWISVKDKIPEKDGRYFVHVPSYNWTGVSSLRQGVFDDSVVTHWMPLPQPPKE